LHFALSRSIDCRNVDLLHLHHRFEGAYFRRLRPDCSAWIRKRSRVASDYPMAYFNSALMGSLLAGALAQKIGATTAIVITGTFGVLGSLWFSLQIPKVRMVMHPIYQEMGLLPK
jgi:hypothetical protein